MGKMEEFEKYLSVERSAAPRTIYDRKRTLTKLSNWLDKKPLSQESLTDYIYYLQKQGLSPVSVKTAVHGISIYLQFATPRGYAPKIKLPKIRCPRKLPILPTKDDVEKILNYHREFDIHTKNKHADLHYSLAIELVARTGMRRNELSCLDCEDLHFDYEVPYIHIRQAKGGRERKIPIPDKMLAQLQGFIEHRKGALFLSCDCRRMRGFALWQELRKRAKLLGIDPQRVTPHKFRHFFVTQLIKNDLSLSKISRISGHSLRVMDEVYTHMVYEDLKDTINSFDGKKPKEDKIVIVERIIENSAPQQEEIYHDADIV